MPAGPDHYPNMSQLYSHELEGINYTKQWYRHHWIYETGKSHRSENEIFIMAPHGGGIESGTTELALATAAFTADFNDHPATNRTYDFFIFNGVNPGKQNGKLHVTASHYDDPVATELVANCNVSLAFHGCTDDQPKKSTGEGYKACLIGGLDETLKQLLQIALTEAGFNAYITTQKTLNGDLPANIINKNKRGRGVQVELTTSFRESLFGINKRNERRKTTNAQFWLFVNTIRESIARYKVRTSMATATEFG